MLPCHKVVILSFVVAIVAVKLSLRNAAVALPIDAAIQVGDGFDVLEKDREDSGFDSVDVLVHRHLLNKRNRWVRQDDGDDDDDDGADADADADAPGGKGRRKGRRDRGAKKGRKRGKGNAADEDADEDENLQDNDEQGDDGQDDESKRRKKNKKGDNENDDGDADGVDGNVDDQDNEDKGIKKKKRDEGDNEEGDEKADDKDEKNGADNEEEDGEGKKRKKKKKGKEEDDADANANANANANADADGDKENDKNNADAEEEEKGKKKKKKSKEEEDDEEEGNEDDDEEGKDHEDNFLQKQEKEKKKREEKRKEKVDLLSSQDNLKGKTLPPKNIAFCHIERTGGTTFKHILVDYAKKQNSTKGASPYLVGSVKKLGSSSESTTVNRIVYGSSKYINMRKKLCCGFYYFALVRNPLERLISKYASDNRLNSRKRSVPSMSFYDYIVRNSKTEHTNEQCRSLGISEKSEVPLIADSLDLVIPTDMFDEGLLLMKEEFRVDTIKYSPRRVAQGVPEVKDIDKRFQSLVELINSCDVALYEYVKNKLAEKLKKRFKGDKDIEQKLTKFRSQLPKDECVNDELPDEENKPMCGLLDYRSVTDQLAQKFLFPDVEHYGPE